jgi:dephospho-CoA kinase
MIRIGIIGDIGSGKSFVAKQFPFPVFNADIEVSKLYKRSRKCFNRLKKALPSYIVSFPIKKEEVSKAILSNKKNLKTISNIIHPEINSKMLNFIKKNKKKNFVVLDIPLLIENKINKKKDILIYVEAKQNQINKRLKKRLNFNLKIFNKFKKLQLPREIKKKKSNYIVRNNFNKNFIKKCVKNILRKIILNA